MKRIVIALAALLAGSLIASAQIPELKPLKNLDETLVPAMKKDKWGYADGKGKIVIKAVFDAAEEFFSVTAPDGVTMDVARVNVDGKWGYITRENVYLVRPEYDTVSRFDQNSLIVAAMGPNKMLMGVRSMISPRINVAVLTSNVLQVNLTDLEPFNEQGLAWASRGGKWGLLNTKGEWVLPCVYDSWQNEEYFGLYRVALGGKQGIVNYAGTELIAPAWDEIDIYDDIRIFRVKNDGKLGILRPDGSMLLAPEFDDLVLDVEKKAFLVKQGEFWGWYAQEDGSAIYPCRFKTIPDQEWKGYEPIVRNGIPMIFIACDKLYSVKEYDDLLYRELGGQAYVDSDILPAWLKSHIPVNPSYVTLDGSLPEPRILPAEFDGSAEHCASIRFKCGVSLADIVLQDEFESIDPMVKVWDLGSKVYVLLHAVEEYYVFYVYDAVLRKTRSYGVSGDMVCVPELGIIAETGVWGDAPLANFIPMNFPESADVSALPILRYSFNSWAGVPFVKLGASVEGASAMKSVKAGDTIIVGKISQGASDMYSEFSAVIGDPAENGIAMYDIVVTDYIYNVVGELEAQQPRMVAHGFIGLDCGFFTQPIFYQARPITNGSAPVSLGGELQLASPEDMKLMDPFVQPE